MIRKILIRCAFLVAMLIETAPASASDISEIVADIAAIRSDSGMASAWLVMVEGETTLIDQGFGIRSWDDPRPVSDSDYYRLGSISKAFTGLALLKAEESGCLRLDALVDELVTTPQLTNPWAGSRPVTLAMLMEQTSGWHDMSWFEFKYNEPVTLESALALRPDSRISLWPPGLHHSYNSSGPGMAAWVLEQACDRDFEQFAREQVFEPMGMSSATYRKTDAVRHRLVGGYDRDPKQAIRYWNFLYRPSGALNLQAGEMAGFLKTMIQRGRLNGNALFSVAQIERMERPTTTLAARAGMRHGYGLGVYSAIEDGRRYFAHGGDADGYLTRFGYSPESGRGFFIVITMFDHGRLRQMRQLLERWVIAPVPRTNAPTDLPTYHPSGRDLQRLVGQYRRATTRFPRDGWNSESMQIRRRDSRLEYRIGDSGHGHGWKPLIPIGPELFRRPSDPLATVFIGESDGRIHVSGEIGNWVRVTYAAPGN